MRDQVDTRCHCPHCGSEAVNSVRTRESTYYHCHDCHDVWRERPAAPRGTSEQQRRSTDNGRQATLVVTCGHEPSRAVSQRKPLPVFGAKPFSQFTRNVKLLLAFCVCSIPKNRCPSAVTAYWG